MSLSVLSACMTVAVTVYKVLNLDILLTKDIDSLQEGFTCPSELCEVLFYCTLTPIHCHYKA